MYSPLEQFSIFSIFNFNIKFLDFSLTNSNLAIIFTFLVYVIIYNNINLYVLPNKWQLVLENLYVNIYNIVLENVGKQGSKYYPLMLSLFIFILIANLLGMIPYFFTLTSHVSITFTLSYSIWIGVTIIGFTKHGLHFLNLFLPQGVPTYLAPLIVSIEVLSYFSRPISLGLRLAANMFAGHTLLFIISSFIWGAFTSDSIFISIAGLIPTIFLFAFCGLELVICFLQAYVFTVLSCSYLNDALNLH